MRHVEYVERFAAHGFEVLTTEREFLEREAALKAAKKNYAMVKFTIRGPCCGQPWETTWSAFDNKKIKACAECNRKAYALGKRDSYEAVVEKFEKHDVQLLTTKEEYDTDTSVGLSRFMFKIIAKCGHERETKYFNFEKCVDIAGVCASCRSRMKYPIAFSWSDMKEKLETARCVLLTTESEFAEGRLNIFSPVRFKGSCGHESIEKFNDIVFKEGRPSTCAGCRASTSAAVREARVNADGTLKCLDVENDAVEWIEDLIGDMFIVERTREGCKADLAVKPKFVQEDAWMGVQLKSCSKMNDNGFAFSFKKNDYTGLVLFATARFAFRMWDIDSSSVKEFDGIQINNSDASVYEKFRIYPRDLEQIAMDRYLSDEIIKKSLDDWMKRDANSLVLEDKCIQLRKKHLAFIPFVDAPNYAIFDFKVNGYNIQEKTARKSNVQYNLDLHKSRGFELLRPVSVVPIKP